MDAYKRLRIATQLSDEDKAELEEQKRSIVITEAEMIDDLEQHEGWQILKDQFIDKGLARQRFLGARAGKLMWIQGFQAALDSLLNFMQAKKDARDQLVSERFE